MQRCMSVTAGVAFVLLVAARSVLPTPSAAPVEMTTSEPVAATVAPAVPTPPSAVVDTRTVKITFYAAYDNDPPGSTTIDHPVMHKTAGGVGSYADPLTFASPVGPGAYPVGTRIYVPLVRKYFIREDTCAVSWTATDGCGAVSHVDLYMGNPSSSQAVLACEDALTPDGVSPIEVDPPADRPYDPAPLWVQATGTCHTH